jgi:sugar fermentation stimulation protein A
MSRGEKMKYGPIVEGVFLRRNNRFVAEVEIRGERKTCHVKNTGRLAELLIPERKVYLETSQNPRRKTGYSLIAVEHDGLLVNIDSQAPNAVAEEWFRAGRSGIRWENLRREVTYGNSRFDFLLEKSGPDEKGGYVEVKGVTLVEENIALFPDAPTLRGVKHLIELTKARRAGFFAMVLFVIQRKDAREFRPNDAMHIEFGDALREAQRTGVVLRAVDCIITADSIDIDEEVLVNPNPV